MTSSGWNGDFGGVSGADSKCAQVAQNAGLSGKWKALMSRDGKNAKTRISVHGRVRNLNGQKVVDDKSDMWDGDIDNAVQYDESGHSVSKSVWTGSTDEGEASGGTCDSWTSSSSYGAAGRSEAATYEWLNGGDCGGGGPGGPIGIGDCSCSNTLALYCIDGQ
ncbi:MAG: DUF1554 domain-containing protein [Bradymonadaceae bacterium]